MSDVAEMVAWLRTQVEADRAAAIHENGCPANSDQWIGGALGPCECKVRDVIADCDAKLAILDDYAEWCVEVEASNMVVMDPPPAWLRLDRWLRLLAQGYRHRDGWREEWAT